MRIRLLRARDGKDPHPGHGTRRDREQLRGEPGSQRQPFDPGALEQGPSACRTKTFVSEVGDRRREMVPAAAGSITHSRRSRARSATKDYPRAWLAVGDDSITTIPRGDWQSRRCRRSSDKGVDRSRCRPERRALFRSGPQGAAGAGFPKACSPDEAAAPA